MLIKQLLSPYKQALPAKFWLWYEKITATPSPGWRPGYNEPPMGFGHWKAGDEFQDDKDYHQMVALDKATKLPILYRNTPVSQDISGSDPDTGHVYAHTWHRNSNSWAIAFDGFGDAAFDDLGSEVCTPAQIDLFVNTVAENCVNLHQPVGMFWSHGEIADVDGYGCDGPNETHERWDLDTDIDPITKKLYPRGRGPVGSLFFPDYIRGRAVLEFARLTKAKWDV